MEEELERQDWVCFFSSLSLFFLRNCTYIPVVEKSRYQQTTENDERFRPQTPAPSLLPLRQHPLLF